MGDGAWRHQPRLEQLLLSKSKVCNVPRRLALLLQRRRQQRRRILDLLLILCLRLL